MQGRTLTCNKYSKSVGAFHFDELCNRPVGPADFLALSQNCPTILLHDIEQLSIKNRNVMRRFINLVDELYNHNVKLYCLASVKLEDLFIHEEDTKQEVYDEAFAHTLSKKGSGGKEVYDESFAIDRTLSRLKEMQSHYYFEKSHKYLIDVNDPEVVEIDPKLKDHSETIKKDLKEKVDNTDNKKS